MQVPVGKYYQEIKEGSIKASKSLVNILKTTKAEILIGATLGVLSGFILTYNHESQKDKLIPLAFSEIEQIEEDSGGEVPHITRYITSTNDLQMKVFECWNHSFKLTTFGDNTKSFALELEKRINPYKKKYKYEIADFVEALPGQAERALESLHQFVEVLERLPALHNNLQAAWEYYFEEVDHPETYLEIVTHTDSNNNVYTTLETRTRIVYDYTWHNYKYNRKAGKESVKDLDSILSEVPELKIPEQILTSRETHAENEAAMQASREKELKGKPLGKDKILELANTWYSGATLILEAKEAIADYSTLVVDARRWKETEPQSKNQRYQTYSNSDDGPVEFQAARKALEDGQDLERHITGMVDSINYVKQKVPELDQKIREYVSVVLEGKPGDGKKLKKEIMGISRGIYSKTFKGGFDVDPFKWYVVALWTFVGALAGTAVGTAVDYAADKTKFYNRLLRR